MFGQSSMKFAALLCFTALPGVFTKPTITPVPLTGTCADYSTVAFQKDRNKSGAFLLKMVSDQISNTTHLYSFPQTSYRYDYTLFYGFIHFGAVSFDDRANFRCVNNTFQGYVPANLPERAWENVVLVEGDPSRRPLGYWFDGALPTAFTNYIDGVKQDGLFLGGYNSSTTWAFSRQSSNSTYLPQVFYSARLLTPTTPALQPSEFTGYVQVVSPLVDYQ